MKKMNVFGAVLCSAALACSMAMPAFAADQNLTSNVAIEGQAADSISATVPLNVSVYVPENGGSITGPTDYAIENTGINTIYLKSLTATASADWTLQDTSAPVKPTGSTAVGQKAQVLLNGTALKDKTEIKSITGSAVAGGKIALSLTGTAMPSWDGSTLGKIGQGQFIAISYVVSSQA